MDQESLDVVQYLAGKGWHGKQGNGAEVVYPCFFDCNEAQDSRKKKLYVNSVDGWYDCKVCGAKGGTYLLMKHFGDDPKVKKIDNGIDPAARRLILKEAAELGAQSLANNDEVLLYLMNERGLTPETIIASQLGFIGGGWSLVGSLDTKWKRDEILATGLARKDEQRKGQDWFYDHILIPYQSRGAVVQMRGRAWKHDKPKYVTGQGDAVRIYNVDDLDDAEDAIIIEGEFDTLVVRQMLDTATDERVRKIAVVGISGTGALPDDFPSYFAHIKRVFIGFDPDESGQKGAAKVKEALGQKARTLRFPHHLVMRAEDAGFLAKDQDWTTFYVKFGMTWQDVTGMLATAGGKRVYSIHEAAHAFHTTEMTRPKMKTGLLRLDATIGGVLPGQVMIVLAKTGTGKTILLCNMAYLMRQYKILIVSLEMTREEIYMRLRRIYWFYNPTATEETVRYALENIYICDENRLNEKGLAEVVDEFELESGVRPEVVMVDYLGYYARGARGNSPYEKNTNAVMQLKAEAKGGVESDPRRRFFVICPAQVNRGSDAGKPIDLDDARDSGAIEETADFLLSLYRPDDALKKVTDNDNVMHSGKLKMEVLKSRHGGVGTTFALQMDMLTLTLADDSTPDGQRAHEHTQDYYRGLTWEGLRKYETRPTQPALNI